MDIHLKESDMVQVTIGKWGNSLAVRLPSDVIQATRLHDGARVDVIASDGLIQIREVDDSANVDDWFKGKTDEEWRAEYRTVSIDWGPDVGREIVPE